MPEGTLQINLPPEVPGCASVKFKAGALPGFGHVCFQDRGYENTDRIRTSKDNKERTAPLELPSSSC